MAGNVADEAWVARIRLLNPGEQADLLAAALRLLQRPDTISTPLESEARVLAEQLHRALGESVAG